MLKGGHKPFREISRETGITTPRVKVRFTRLVNVGFIKSISLIFDHSIVENEIILKPAPQQHGSIEDSQVIENQGERYIDNKPLYQQKSNKFKIKRGIDDKAKL